MMQMLARYRQKDTFPRLLSFCQGMLRTGAFDSMLLLSICVCSVTSNFITAILTEFDRTPPAQRDHRKKDGVIVLIVSVAMVGFHHTKEYSYHHMLPLSDYERVQEIRLSSGALRNDVHLTRVPGKIETYHTIP